MSSSNTAELTQPSGSTKKDDEYKIELLPKDYPQNDLSINSSMIQVWIKIFLR